MRGRGLWTWLPIDGVRGLVYSPRSGRTYLIPLGLATSRAAPPILGLHAVGYRSALVDPADRIALVAGTDANVGAGWLVRSLYVQFHRHRTLFAIDRAMRLSRWLARIGPKYPHCKPSDIGHAVMAVETSLGISDCYPRALVTAYFCMAARLECDVTVGILSPTTKMHAWCSTDGVIPYEPRPSHWYYSPLAVCSSQ